LAAPLLKEIATLLNDWAPATSRIESVIFDGFCAFAGGEPQYSTHQIGHTTLEMIVQCYRRWMRKPERVGR
jgi:hypothetical protein